MNAGREGVAPALNLPGGGVLVDEKDFQKRVQRIGELVDELETIADPAARTTAKRLMQSLMDMHGQGSRANS